MSPELRFVAQLSRLARALEQASDRLDELGEDVIDEAVLERCAFDIRALAHERLERWVAERGSAKSAT